VVSPDRDAGFEALPRTERARRAFEQSAPVNPYIHLFTSELGPHLLLVDGSRIFDIDADAYADLEIAQAQNDNTSVEALLREFGLDHQPYVDDEPIIAPQVRALSLAVAQKCNLGCQYCYAQGGSFGGPSKGMPAETAVRAIEMLFRGAAPGERVNLAFMGGEPLVARDVIRLSTQRAEQLSRETGAPVGFSITTNGTLVTPDDGEFFEEHGFSVTVSLDGIGETHDRLRPYKSGRGTFARIMANIAPLLRMQRRMQVSARATVTVHNLQLRDTLDQLIALGFHSVGFSPLLRSPTGTDELGHAELEVMLDQMIACGEEFERRVIAGQRYPFANMVNAMRELHRGTHRPYPCGAGAGYLGVSADGDLAACHRFVGDEEGAMGNLDTGVDLRRQTIWLTQRHVHRQEPCKTCWARYMCGGGCHHEVIRRGRPACDYIRGWLHYNLGAHSRLVAQRPDYFGLPISDTTAPSNEIRM
jgi:uncharacterized protein